MKDFPEIFDEKRLSGMYSALGLPEQTLDLLFDYFSAFSNLYEILALRDAYRIIRKQNDNIISKEKFIEFSEVVRHDKKDFYYILARDELYDDEPECGFFDMEIVHESLVDIDFDEYYSLADEQEGKPLYIPEKEELLKYKDDFYFERTQYYDNALRFIRENLCKSAERAEIIMENAYLVIQFSNGDATAVLNEMERSGAKFTEKRLKEFFPLLKDLMNNTRIPHNRGYTSAELRVLFPEEDEPDLFGTIAGNPEKEIPGFADKLPVTVKKVGRNEPCPCGSGKKYKKCCGR